MTFYTEFYRFPFYIIIKLIKNQPKASIYLKNEHKLTLDECLDKSVFIGDSPNDEPMFEKFPHSVGVANIKKFATQLQSKPAYVTDSEGGQGFSEFANHLLKKRETP